ncbi:MAG: hypothetical protein ACE5GE_15975 [Phycisphaerae bacterium]
MNRTDSEYPPTSLATRRGIALTEAVVSMLVVSVMVLAALNTVGASRVGQYIATDRVRGDLLARELMAEILQQAYEEPVDPVLFGRENESGGNRSQYDDVDDYESRSFAPPEYKDGTAMTGLDTWERRADVIWVSPADLDTAVFIETGIKRVTVEVLHNGVPVAKLVALATGSVAGQRLGAITPRGN